MESSADNYSYLIHKIDEFIRKYYLNQIVRGILYLSISVLVTFILVATAEYYGYFGKLIRALLFFGFIILNLSILARFLLKPLLSFVRLGKILTHEQAAEIIGNHFSHISDKLLNILQLRKLADNNQAQKELINAGINQKIRLLRPVPFSSAIKITENKKYLRYLVPPLLIIAAIGLTAPSILSDGTERIIHYNKKYVRKAPFNFVVLNKKLTVVQGDDLKIRLKLTGEEIPQDIYIEDGPNSYKLDKENIIRFNYTFRNIQNDKRIRFVANGYYSEPLFIDVKQRPSLINSEILLTYPSYIKKPARVVRNTEELSVPQGTKLEWRFTTEHSEILTLKENGINQLIKPAGENSFRYSMKAVKNTLLGVRPLNREVKLTEPIFYRLNVIEDRRPSIEVTEKPDSLNKRARYFIGTIADDYGFSALSFCYRVAKDKNTEFKRRKVDFTHAGTEATFLYAMNINELGLKPGEHLEYFFEVRDNDGVNGPKGTRTAVKTYRVATEEETEIEIEKSSSAVKQKMQEAIRKAGQISREAKSLNQELVNKRSLSFDEKKQIEEVLRKQKELENIIQEIQKENKKTQFNLNDLQDQKKEILEKQKQIEELFNQVLDEKTREILKNIEKLLEENNKIATQEELSKMQMDNKSVSKEMDRILELYKQLEFEQKLAAVTRKINQLSDQQQELAKDTRQNVKTPEQLLKRQNDLKKSFDEIDKDLEDLKKKDDDLTGRNGFEKPVKERQQIEQLQKQITRNLQNNDHDKAADNMQKAASQMKQMAGNLEKIQSASMQNENKLNLQNLRQILASLLKSSFAQEQLMLNFKNTSVNDPHYTLLTQNQRDIRENLQVISDSLYSLSKKVPQIQTIVRKEIEATNENINEAIEHLAERRTAEATRNQQFAMTSINNLALMLSEVENQLQKAMQRVSQRGNGGQRSLGELSKAQDQLNKNMQKVRQQMQKEENQGNNSKNSQLSEQMVKMAREQQMIRQALHDINRELNKEGQGKIANLEKIGKEMEQTETDLVNKRIERETLLRQQEILAKLLEADKAEREKDTDPKRESKEGKDLSPVYGDMLKQFKKIRQRETELIKTVPASLSLFYQLKVGDYFRHLDTK